MTVALSGRGWTLAPSLVQLLREADKVAPNRSRLSDGTIGDAAHRSRPSDHNPYGGYVHALDITHDPRRGMDIHAHARNIAARHDGRINYIISNAMIAEASNGFRWRRYDGENPHRLHAHFSVRRTTLARFDRSNWLSAIVLFPTQPPPVVVEPKPTPLPLPAPIPTQPLPVEDDTMYLFRDHNGTIWLLGLDGSRKACTSMDEVNLLKMTIAPKYIDLGGNAIQSQIILNKTFVR